MSTPHPAFPRNPAFSRKWAYQPAISAQLIPVAEKIAQQTAIVYLGAGASASSGLPGWGDLLGHLKKIADDLPANNFEDSKKYFDKLFEGSKNLEAADWLQELLDENVLFRNLDASLSKTKVGSVPEPSPIHRAVARIPFSIALTTNYDTLLEQALHVSQAFDFRRTDDIIGNLVAGSFPLVIKTHGTLRSEMILSARQYGELMNEHKQFGDLLKWLFTSRTCLFVGASLQDPDLLYLFDQARAEYGARFGPHYALLPSYEAPQTRIALLSRLKIKVISYDADREDPQRSTEIVSRILTDLSGKVALERLKGGFPGLPNSDENNFSLRSSMETLLEKLREITGAFRADFCGSNQVTNASFSTELRYLFHTTKTVDAVKNAVVLPENVCGVAYYKSAVDSGVYLTNREMKTYAEGTKIVHYGNIEYREGFPGIMSELAVPVEVDGIRIGVLNLESDFSDAFSAGHLEVMHWFAEKAGRLYRAATERRRRSALLDQKAISGDSFRALQVLFDRLTTMVKDRDASGASLGVLVYMADYLYGKLDAQNPKLIGFTECIASPSFGFGEKASLVASVFSSGEPIWFADAQRAIKGKSISPRFDKSLRLRGAVIGFPVIVQGHIAGVISVWRADGAKDCLDGRDVELMRRAAQLITNAYVHPSEPKRALPGLALASRIVGLFPSNHPGRAPLQQYGHLREEIFPLLRGCLRVLSNEENKFREKAGHASPPKEWICPTRSRLWLRLDDSDTDVSPRFLLIVEVSLNDAEKPYRTHFEGEDFPEGALIASETYPRFTTTEGWADETKPPKTRPEPIKIRKWIGPEREEAMLYRNNPHQSFLMSRVRADRFARVQRPNLLGVDILAKVLRKGESRPWFVAPIYRAEASEWSQDEFAGKRNIENLDEQRVLGYLTVDEEVPETPSRDAGPAAPLMDEGWSAFQNTILSSLDLFSACLAERLVG